MPYYWGQDYQKMEPEFDPGFIEEGLRMSLAIANGQKEMFDNVAKVFEPEQVMEKLALLKHYEVEEDERMPIALVVDADGVLQPPGEMDGRSFTADRVRVLCPQCGHYTVGMHGTADGF